MSKECSKTANFLLENRRFLFPPSFLSEILLWFFFGPKSCAALLQHTEHGKRATDYRLDQLLLDGFTRPKDSAFRGLCCALQLGVRPCRPVIIRIQPMAPSNSTHQTLTLPSAQSRSVRPRLGSGIPGHRTPFPFRRPFPAPVAAHGRSHPRYLPCSTHQSVSPSIHQRGGT